MSYTSLLQEAIKLGGEMPGKAYRSEYNEYLEEKASYNSTILTDNGEGDIAAAKNRLRMLLILLSAWDYNSPVIPTEVRNHIKYKAELDKNDRTKITKGLGALIYLAAAEAQRIIRHEYLKNGSTPKTLSIDSFRILINSSEAVYYTNTIINEINEAEKELFNATSYTHEEPDAIAKAGEAIEGFIHTNRKKVFAKYLAKGLSVLASIGMATVLAASIPYLLPGTIGIMIATATLIFGTGANYRFYSKALPDFFNKLLKKGSITEYIGSDGERKQLKAFPRFVVLPITAVGALIIAISSTAFTVKAIAGIAFMAGIPAFALPLAYLAGISVGVALAVVCVAASIKLVKKIAEDGWLKNKLSTDSKLALAIKLIVGAVVFTGITISHIFGLRYVAAAVGEIAAIVFSALALIGKAAFVATGVNKLTLNPFNYYNHFQGSKAFYYISLIWNAIASGALLFRGSPESVVAGLGVAAHAAGSIMDKPVKHEYLRVVVEDQLAVKVGLRNYNSFTPAVKGNGEDVELKKYYWDNNAGEPKFEYRPDTELFARVEEDTPPQEPIPSTSRDTSYNFPVCDRFFIERNKIINDDIHSDATPTPTPPKPKVAKAAASFFKEKDIMPPAEVEAVLNQKKSISSRI